MNADISTVMTRLLAFAPPMPGGWGGGSWIDSVFDSLLPTEHTRPNTGRWIGALWHNGQLISADRFTSRTRARRWANISRADYGRGVVRVVPYRARHWKRLSPQDAELARLRNIANRSVR